MSAKTSKKKGAKKNTPKAATVNSNSFLDSKYFLVSILILTFFLFYNTLTNTFFTLDDPAYIADNPYIKTLSAKSIKEIFLSFYNANYHPLTTISYGIEYYLFGLNARPYHLINLLIHLLNIVLAFRFVQKFSGRKDVAAIVALFFAIHPMHVESVAWISERKDVLYTFFYISGLYTYLIYLQANVKKNKWYVYTLLLFVLSLLSKPAAITFPLMILLIDLYYRRGLKINVLLEKVPFFILSLVFGVITILAQKSAGAINAELMPDYSLWQRVLVVCYATAYYIIKLILPFNLAVLNYAPEELDYYYFLSPLVLLLLVFLAYKAKKYKSELIFGLLFYLIGVSLTIQIIPVGYAVVSDRYTYLPYIGLFLIGGYFYAGIRDNKFPFSATWKPYLNLVLLGITFFFAIITFQRNKVWNDSVSLFKDVVEKYPQVANAHFTLGKNLMDIPDVNGALAAYNKAIELDSLMPEIYFYRGNLYYGQKNYSSALADYMTATKLNSKYAEAFFNIGVCNNTLGNFQLAIEALSKAIGIRPNEYMYQARASSFFNLRRFQEALTDYTSALTLNPQSGEILYNRGATYFNMQQTANACEDWKKSVSLGYTKSSEMVSAYCR